MVDKEEFRNRMRKLSFSEKIRILEKLRERSLTIAASGLRKKQDKGQLTEHSGTRSAVLPPLRFTFVVQSR